MWEILIYKPYVLYSTAYEFQTVIAIKWSKLKSTDRKMISSCAIMMMMMHMR